MYDVRIFTETLLSWPILRTQFMTHKSINNDLATKSLLKTKRVLLKMLEQPRDCDRSFLWLQYRKDGTM